MSKVLDKAFLESVFPPERTEAFFDALFGGYDPRLVPAGTDLYRSLLHATLAAAGIVGTIVFLTGTELSRAYFLAFFLLGPPLLLLVRLALRRWLNGARTRGLLSRRSST